MSMNNSTTSRPGSGWLSRMVFVVVICGMATGAYWQWRGPIHESLARINGGSLSAVFPPSTGTAVEAGQAVDADHRDAPETDHAHDHAGHSEESSIELSEQARRSLGLREGEIALTTFARTISVPATVVERKGRSKFTVIATMTGYLTGVNVSEGQAVSPGQPLFELRLTHEELVQSQADLLRTTEEVDVVTREIARLEGIGPEGLIPIKTILERKYELQKLGAVRTSQRQALLLHGITDQQIDTILQTRTLLGTLLVRAPDTTVGVTSPASPLVVQELFVERGQHVNAGDTLAVLADHETLFIEGSAFEQDIPHISRVARDGGSVTGIAEADATDEPRTEGLRIVSIASRLDPESRTLHFYVLLPNSVVRDTKEDGDRRFVEWRYKPGQRMQLHIPVEKWTDRIVLPVEAVAQEGLENYVFRVNGDHYDRQPVHVEHRDPQVIVIANDGALFPGDRIALSAAQQLQVAVKTKAGGGVDPHAGHNH